MKTPPPPSDAPNRCTSRWRRRGRLFDWEGRGQYAPAGIDFMEEVHQRLHSGAAWVRAIAVSELARQRLGNTGDLGNGGPSVGTCGTQMAFQELKSGLHGRGV